MDVNFSAIPLAVDSRRVRSRRRRPVLTDPLGLCFRKVDVPNILSFQLSTSAVALTLITLSAVFGLGNMNPLNAMQILFTNILVDGGHSLPSV